jgi:hypothetical protein
MYPEAKTVLASGYAPWLFSLGVQPPAINRSRSAGITGHDNPESLVTLTRNTHLVNTSQVRRYNGSLLWT